MSDSEDKEFFVRLCLLVISEALPIRLTKCELHKDGTKEHVTLDKETPMRRHQYTKNYKQSSKLGQERG